MSVITLTTDFGEGSPYVAAMKGVILSLHPAATIVDITHVVPPQDIRHAALVLEDATGWFPAGTIHIAVVDPGVGTERGVIFARIDRQNYVCPDNGLLSRLARRTAPEKIIRIVHSEYYLQPVSATFHGRDIMAPVAARLSLGLDPDRLGPPQKSLVLIDEPALGELPDGIEGSVLWVDSFGNLVTDVTQTLLADHDPRTLRFRCNLREVAGLSCTYGANRQGALVALFGSSGRLEIAVVGGSAAAELNAMPGTRVSVHWDSGKTGATRIIPPA
jgi:S-adenosylmethionine hydrolase